MTEEQIAAIRRELATISTEPLTPANVAAILQEHGWDGHRDKARFVTTNMPLIDAGLRARLLRTV